MSYTPSNPKIKYRPLSWTLPSDPTKPEIPYHCGTSLSIRAHTPPPPFGSGYRRDVAPRPIAKWTDVDGKTQTEWCSQHPVIDTPPHPDETIHHLLVLEEVACRDGRGAQVLRCSLDDSSDDTTYIAKIYDPLYYTYVDSYDDPTWRADRDYSSEAAAYEELKKAGVDGSLTPKYYGSWTFDMVHPETPQATRSVRMILMEWIPDSVTMHYIVEGGFRGRMSPQHRLDILAKALEVNSKIEFYGVRHLDFAPRNVLLVGPDVFSCMPRVILFDFNRSSVFSQPGCIGLPYESKLPISPQHLFWGSCPDEFERWTPYPHSVCGPVFFGWLKSCWENSTEFDGPPESLQILNSLYDDTPEYAPPIEDEDWESDAHSMASN
ncbi:Protein kinase-like domain protein [Ceratocystis lukuohia]|uniref:Protein kinase-like domain protein n=1 Tax=Ceratocystis lukuohia TaxID=2019550 RepID=A0ABR4MHC7_9PEZI